MAHALSEAVAAVRELEGLRAQAACPRVQLALERELQVLRAEVAHQEQLLQAPPTGPAPMDMDGIPPPIDSIPRPIPTALPIPAPTLVNCTATTPVKNPVDLTSYGWDQSTKFVKVYATVRDCGSGFSTEHCKLEVDGKHFRVLVACPSGKFYRLAVGPLGGKVAAEGSSVKAKADGSVTISLRKADSSTWTDLKAKEEKVKTPSIEKDEDPSAGIMKLMKNLYDEGDDEMKKTISKAFYESQMGKKDNNPL